MSVEAPERNPRLRRATKRDAEPLARLVGIAGDGVPTHLWAEAAQAGETALDVGIRRAGREEGGFSYRNASVAETVEGRIAGMLLGYRQPDPYDPGDPSDLPAFVRPLVELEALAPGSWYVNALAVFPEFRGCGFGTALLRLADRLAGESGARRLSLIVAAENRRARKLYEGKGYREVARRPVVPLPGFAHVGDEWVLMVKDVGG